MKDKPEQFLSVWDWSELFNSVLALSSDCAVDFKTRCIPRSHVFYVWFARANPYTGGKMSGVDLDQLWLNLTAGLNRKWTTCVKATSGWGIDGGRNVAFQHDALSDSFYLRIRHWHR